MNYAPTSVSRKMADASRFEPQTSTVSKVGTRIS